jgi:biofilm PGA synthesis lipoprotein PgaB
MMRWLATLLFLAAAGFAAADSGSFAVLSYHEVRDDVRDYPDPYAVDATALVAQFSWLRDNGYTPVSVERILAARRGGAALPAKAVLLSFDDGYLSFYTRVYPLLREFRFPAVLAVVAKWIDDPPGTASSYGEKASVADASFPSWTQLREMAGSGWVEIASHSYDLHRGVPANPQGNLQPAATARLFDAGTGTYEDDARWRSRVRADLARSAEVIEREIGRRPRVIVWPYGSYNGELVAIAGELGMPVALTLEDGANGPDVPLAAVRRVLVAHNPPLADFIAALAGPRHPEPVRAVQLGLDAVYDPDPAEQERKLSILLDRVRALRPSHVFLAAGDPAAYFPTRHVPVRADLFNRVAWQLASRAEVKVHAVLPAHGYGLRPEQLAELYADLARHAHFDGLVSPARGEAAHRWRALAVLPGPLVMLDASNTSAEDMARRMRALQLGGALHFGYRGDDFLRDRPPLAVMAPALSLGIHPR